MSMSLWECSPTPCLLCGEDLYVGTDICPACGWDQKNDPSEYPEVYQQEIYDDFEPEWGFPLGTVSFHG